MGQQIYGPKTLINVATAAVSALATHTFVSFDMSEASRMAIQTEWGADVTGTFTLWERIDSSVQWRQNTVASFTAVTSGATGGQVLDNIGAIAPCWGLKFTYTSGVVGPLIAKVYVKGSGE
jgi:hypothetical protein